VKFQKAIAKAASLGGGGVLSLVGSKPGRIVVQRGPLLAVITVDPKTDVPWGVVDSKTLLAAVRDMDQDPLFENDRGGVKIKSNGTWTRVPCVDSVVPAIPALPVLRTVPDWSLIERVFHAAGPGTDDRAELACIRFAEDVTEATDTARIARAKVGFGSGQLVPLAAFERWPTGSAVEAAFTSSHAWFQVGDELRVVKLAEGWFPSLRDRIPEKHDGPVLSAPRKVLEQAVTRAWKSSPMKAVHFRVVGPADSRAPHVIVSRVNDENPKSSAFEARIDVETTCTEAMEFVFDGKRLTEALKAIPGEHVAIGYHLEQGRPIRLESDRYVELLYPLVPMIAGDKR
jgi:hypothetical protein